MQRHVRAFRPIFASPDRPTGLESNHVSKNGKYLNRYHVVK
jgi:hypothetical protein